MIDFSHLYVCCEIAKQQKNIAPVKNVFVQCELFSGEDFPLGTCCATDKYACYKEINH
jgi:hypothetical protein